MKKRKNIFALLLFIIVFIGIGLPSRHILRPLLLLQPEDSVQSVFPEGGFRILKGGTGGRDVTHLVDLYELFALLSQTRIRRSNDWQGAMGADWLFWNMGGRSETRFLGRSIRGRTIAFRGEQAGMIGEVGFGMQSFSLSNACEILAFLVQAASD